MKYVKWLEPDKNGKPIVNMIPVSEAITVAKRYGVYENDQQALDEFVVINCAEFVDIEDDRVTHA